MNLDQKIAITELKLFSLLNFVLSGFHYGQFCTFDHGRQEGEKIIGLVKDETTKNLHYFSLILKRACHRRHTEYLRAMSENRRNTKDLKRSLRRLEERQRILERLFWISVAEELPQVSLMECVSVVDGWEVVSDEYIPKLPVIDYGLVSSSFFSHFRNIVVCGHLTFEGQGPELIPVRQGELIIGHVPSSVKRIYSLLEPIQDEVSLAIEQTGLQLDIEGGPNSVFDEVDLLGQKYPEVDFSHMSFLREIYKFTERVFWELINDDYPHIRVENLGVRAGFKVVRLNRVSSS